MNALTIDVEDYFHVSAFARHIARSNGTACPAVWNATLILFSTCWTSTVRTPPFHPELGRATLSNLIRRIVAQGLNWRAMAMRINVPTKPAEFRDIRLSKTLLEQQSGQAVLGYRAPVFRSVGELVGLEQPGKTPAIATVPASIRYTMTITACRMLRVSPASTSSSGLLELPVSTVRLLGYNLPAGGGGYFRLLPYRVSRWALRHINSHDGQAGIFYFHPWELDPDQPIPPGIGLQARCRHRLNLHRMQGRIARLLSDFRWGRIDHIFGADMTPHYTVGLMGTQDRIRWDHFVQHCEEATFFHRAGWQQVIEEAFGHPTWFMYAANADGIKSVLPLAHIKSALFGNT
jgi:polysaccharide deacetylase family protein (PEP-CTERM system associated)